MLSHGLIHVANVIYLASYAVKDIKALRWLTIAGIVLLIPYYLAYDLYAAAIWNGIFLGINLFRLKNKPANNSPQSEHEKSSSVSLAPSVMCTEGHPLDLSGVRGSI